jgi:hypothetical protein
MGGNDPEAAGEDGVAGAPAGGAKRSSPTDRAVSPAEARSPRRGAVVDGQRHQLADSNASKVDGTVHHHRRRGGFGVLVGPAPPPFLPPSELQRHEISGGRHQHRLVGDDRTAPGRVVSAVHRVEGLVRGAAAAGR